MTTGQRLKQIKRELNLTAAQLAEMLKIPARTIGGYERDEAPPNQKFLNALIEVLHIDVNWFLTGRGNKYLDENYSGNADCFDIPVRGDVNASMGYGVTVYNESRTAGYSISKKLASDLGISRSRTEMIFAQGDSMLPTIEGGDSLLVDHSRKEIYDGKIYCVRIDGQLYAKRLQKIPPNTVRIVSDNEKYRSFEIDFSKDIDFDFEVIGEIPWWGRVAR